MLSVDGIKPLYPEIPKPALCKDEGRQRGTVLAQVTDRSMFTRFLECALALGEYTPGMLRKAMKIVLFVCVYLARLKTIRECAG